MKFRRDFVTNSSSSSFIIGKYGEGIDKNTVYELVRHIYKEFLELKDKIKPVARDYNIQWNEERQCFSYIKFGKLDDELIAERRKINARLKKDFGVELFDLDFSHNYGWLDCETYDDFLAYYSKEDGSDRDSCIPFEIVDFENDRLMPNGELFRDSFDYQEIIEWYLPCMLFPGNDEDYDYLGNYVGDCGECPYNDTDTCEKIREKSKLEGWSKETLVCKALGKIGVLSYCGKIPDYVVEHLGAKSIVHCNHMG